MFVLSWRPLDGCNHHREGPQIYPEFASRVHRGKSVTKWRFPPWGGGGTVHHSRPANSSITQLKIFFSAFGACDFLLISYCSWAK